MPGGSPHHETRAAEAKRRVRAYLERYCVGATHRRPARLIKLELDMDPPLEDREFYRATQALLKEDGLPIAAEDAGENPGLWIATNPDDLDLRIYRMDFRLHGIIDTLNTLLRVRRGLWPLDKFPPKPERALRGGAPSRLPGAYQPAGAKMRGVNRQIGREAKRLAAGGAPSPSVEVFEYVCIGCGESVVRSLRPDQSPTHAGGCRDALLLMPRDDAERARWAAEIRRVENLQAERSLLNVGGDPCVPPVAVEVGGRA